jgi:hypothetical protein
MSILENDKDVVLPFNEEFQQSIVGHCINDYRFFYQCKDKLKPQWFTKNLMVANIFEQMVNSYDIHGVAPRSTGEIMNEPFFLSQKESEKDKYRQMIELCSYFATSNKAFNLEKVKKQLTGFIRLCLFKEAVEGAGKQYKTGGFDKAYTWTKEKIEKIQDASFEEDAVALKFENAMEWLKDDILETTNAISTGNKKLDFVLGGGLFKGETTAILAPVNSGKCLGKDTFIIMSNGIIKMVQDIKVGDKLMGPDGLPRTVLGTTKGRGQLYKIQPKNGSDDFICNDEHILCLKVAYNDYRYKKDDIINISVNEYLKKSKNFKNHTLLWRASLNFNEKQELKIPPYILGIWLGDGNSNRAALTSMDSEIIKEWTAWVENMGCSMKIDSFKTPNKSKHYTSKTKKSKIGCKKNAFINDCNKILNEIGVLNKKHIPHEYLISNRIQRLELLAGLLDTDGYYNKRGCFEIIQKNKYLSDQIVFLARSLGFKVNMQKTIKTIKKINFSGEYYRINISGLISKIPTRLPRKKAKDCKKTAYTSGFNVIDQGVGDYYGFELDKDHLFLLGDFTVSHNSTFMITTVRHAIKQGKKVLWLTHEDSPRKLRKKMLSAFLGISRKTLSNPEFFRDRREGDEPDKIAFRESIRKDLFAASNYIDQHLTYVPYTKIGSMFVEDVASEIYKRHKHLINTTGSGFDMIVDDYPKKLRLRHKNPENYRTELAAVYDVFNHIAIELDVHCFVAIQTNREGLKQSMGKVKADNLLGMDLVDESYGIAQNMGNIISLNRSPDDKLFNIAKLSISKSRNDITDIAIVTRTAYAQTLTHGDKDMFNLTFNFNLPDPSKNYAMERVQHTLKTLTPDIPNHFLASQGQNHNKLIQSNVINEILMEIEKNPSLDSINFKEFIDSFSTNVKMKDVTIKEGDLDGKTH